MNKKFAVSCKLCLENHLLFNINVILPIKKKQWPIISEAIAFHVASNANNLFYASVPRGKTTV